MVVGAGMAGLYAVHRLREDGLSVRAFERGPKVGGTWYWNRYPGCRCDVESVLYSYKFSEERQQEWRWSSRYAGAGEIQAYLERVADKFHLRRDIQLNATVEAARFDEASGRWEVTVAGEKVWGRHLVMASGCLSRAVLPGIEGVEDFGGAIFHTSDWPEEGVDLRGKRVGIIGTGSSGIQAAPLIAAEAEHLHVFQRTPQFSIPAWNRPLGDDEYEQIRAGYADLRREAAAAIGGVPYEEPDHDAPTAPAHVVDGWLEQTWARGGYPMILSYPDILTNDETSEIVGEWVKRRIRERIDDPAVAERLMPSYPFGAKRLCVDTEYFETFNRPNVTLVDLREEPIERIVETGVETASGLVELDVLVLATGFDALTGALLAIDPQGRGGLSLSEKWADGPAAVFGVMSSGFPNMFMVNGPGSVSVLYNMVASIEQNVDWIADAIAHVRTNGYDSIESTDEADRGGARHVDEVAATTMFTRVEAWYTGANGEGKAKSFLAYTGGG
ncbi:MAG: cyclohexanone monooxygenase, partial [Solirubrobacterales bacterium 70-9]